MWQGKKTSPEHILLAVQAMNQRNLPWPEDIQDQHSSNLNAHKKPVNRGNLKLSFEELETDHQHCQLAITIDGSFQISEHRHNAAIAWVIEDNIGNLIFQH